MNGDSERAGARAIGRKGRGGGGDLKKRKRTKQNKPTEFKKIIYKILRNFNFFIKLNEYPLHSINLPLKGK